MTLIYFFDKPFQMKHLPLDPSWKLKLEPEFNKTYMKDLIQFLDHQEKLGKTIYPPSNERFAALNLTPFEKVKVVILGQDPYHGDDEAHGLCFSVKQGITFPPSLRNIFKELESDLGIKAPGSGDLTKWGQQGVLLLNSILSVEKDKAASHQGQGWEQFTDFIIHLLATEKENLVFVLWGSYAQKKGSFIDRKRHLVIESPHPSPLSSYRGFFGSKPFSKINHYLNEKAHSEIDWKL